MALNLNSLITRIETARGGLLRHVEKPQEKKSLINFNKGHIRHSGLVLHVISTYFTFTAYNILLHYLHYLLAHLLTFAIFTFCTDNECYIG